MGSRRWAWIAGGALALTLFVHFCVRIVPPEPYPVTGDQPKAAETALRLPVVGLRPEELSDTFTQSRAAGMRRHDAIDIMAARGTAVVAAAGGRVEKLFVSHDGGLTVYVRSPDGRWSYYYAHLDSYAPNLREGAAVRAGDPIGAVGATGNANPAAPHLHFAIHAMQKGDRWWQGRAINPYPLLVPPS